MFLRARGPALAVLLLVSACGSAPTAVPQADGSPPPFSIAIQTDPSLELRLAGEIYGQALEGRGYVVRRLGEAIDSTALVEAVVAGTADLAPVLMEGPRGALDGDGELASRGLTLLAPSRAELSVAFAVRDEDANAAGYASMSDVAADADSLAWGLPSDCSSRPDCAAVLSAYGLQIELLRVVEAPICEPGTATSLNDAAVDVVVACTTQAELVEYNLRILEDDREAATASVIAPGGRTQWIERAPDEVVSTLAAVNAALTTEALLSMTAQVSSQDRDVTDVVREWLRDMGLGRARAGPDA